MTKKGRLALTVACGVAVAFVIVAVAAYGWLRYAPRRVPAGQPPLVTLEPNSVAAVQEAFNAGAGEVRVLAMLSPT